VAFTWGDFHDIVGARLRDMGVENDVLDMLMRGYVLLQQLVDTYDLAAYTVQNDAMFLTMAGHREYPLPEDFGRLLHVHDEVRSGLSGAGESGVFLRWGPAGSLTALRYRDPILFRQQASTQASVPQTFTLGQHGGMRALLLDPSPDNKDGIPYLGEGVYIARVERPDLDDPILLDEPTLLVAGVLAQLAMDRGLPQAQMLQADYQRYLSALVNNAHRVKQQFSTARWPVNRGAIRG